MIKRTSKTNTILLLAMLAMSALPMVTGCSKAAATEADPAENVPVVSMAEGAIVAEAVIEPARWSELRFDIAGDVTEVLVEPGQEVAAGAPMVRLDAGELALSLEIAEQDVIAQRAALDRLLKGASQASIARAARENAQQTAQAEIALRVKRLQLEKAQAQDPAANVTAAQATARQLEFQLAQARAQDATPDVKAAEVEAERAQIALDETRDEYNKALDRPWEPQEVRDGWAKQLKQAELNYEVAQAQLEKAQSAQQAHGIGLDVLTVQLDDARAQLDLAVRAQETYTVTLNMLSAEVEAARLSLEALREWENPYLDEASDEEVTLAVARLRQAELAVARLGLQVQDAELVAPFGGMVVDVSIEVGDRVAPGEVVIVLATLDELTLRTIDLTELDVARITTGQPVVVTVDALSGREFAGQVKEVDLRGHDYRGDVVYDVVIELMDAGEQPLRWGMTAMVKIEVR